MHDKKWINITFRTDEHILIKLDDVARRYGMSRSHLLRTMIAGTTPEQCGALIMASRKNEDIAR